jgi:hypothetical protein
MTRITTLATVLTATLVLTACGSEDSAPRTQSAGDPDRYCALVREMDAAGTKFFARLEGKKNATPADYEAAERRFVERYAPQFEEIERAAPAEVRDDVRILLAGQRARAGLGGAVDEAEASAAEERILRYERRACS